MEGEANRFAAELLIPSKWLNTYYAEKQKIKNLILDSLDICGTSLDATLIKIFNVIKEPIICFELYGANQISDYFSTPSVPKCYFNKGDVLQSNPFTIPGTTSTFERNGRFFKAWEFELDKLPVIEETDKRDWRTLLNEILNETDSQNLKQSVNAILANAFQRHKHLERQKICEEIVKSFNGRTNVIEIVRHPLFKDYIIKRVNELISKNK